MKGLTEIIIWDVQRGCSVTAILPDGRILWFDCGTGSCQSGVDFSPYKFMKSPLIDLLVLSHPHKSHLEDFCRIPPDNVKKCLFSSRLSRYYIEAFRELEWSKVNIQDQVVKNFVIQDSFQCGVACSYRFPFGALLTIFGYWVEENIGDNMNNYSVVIFFAQGNNLLCLPGDIEEEGWEYLLQKHSPLFEDLLRKTNIFVASHHGSKSGFFSNLSSLLRAEIVVVPDGAKSESEAMLYYEGITSGHIVQKEIRNSTEWLYPPNFKKIKVLTARNNGNVKIFLSENNFSALASKGV